MHKHAIHRTLYFTPIDYTIERMVSYSEFSMLTIDELKQLTRTVQSNNLAVTDEQFQARVLKKYTSMVSTTLLTILNNDPFDVLALEQLLNENWTLIKGTSVCYTAIPTAEITLLLCEAARFCAQEKKILAPTDKATPLALLMPGIITDPSRDAFYRLAKVSFSPSSSSAVATAFFLTDGHDGVLQYGDDNFYYANATERTCIPLSLSDGTRTTLNALFEPLTELDEAVVPDALHQREITTIIHHRPTVLYPDLSSLDLGHILKSHILDDHCVSLLPIALLEEMNTLSRDLLNPYYDYSVAQASPSLSDKEKERLINHGSLTRDIAVAEEHYELLLNDPHHLLGHLRQLCKRLAFNSVTYAGGIGTETHAGMGTYAAIVAFNTYYETLGDNKERIPTRVREEIDTLITLASDPSANLRGTETTQTCIATRRKQLETAMMSHESLLSTLGIPEEDAKTRLLELARTAVENTKRTLRIALNTNQNLDGHDTLELTTTLLQALSIDFSIDSVRDLLTLRTLSPDEIRALMSPRRVQEQFISEIRTMDRLVLFSLGTSPARLQALFQTIAPVLSSHMIKSPSELSQLLISLDAHRCQLISEALTHCISSVIKQGDDLIQLLQPMSEEQGLAICIGLENHFSSIIKNSFDFARLFQRLGVRQRIAVYNALKANYPSLIKTSGDFCTVAQHLPQEQRTELFIAMQDKLPLIIHNNDALYDTLYYLEPFQCSTLCMALKSKPLSIIKNHMEFTSTLHYLNPLQREAVFNVLKTTLPMLIKTPDDLTTLCSNLSDAEKTDPMIQALTQLINLSKYRLNPKKRDIQLDAYLEEARQKLAKADTADAVQELQDEFDEVLASVNSPQIHTIQMLITTWRGGLTCGDLHNNKKANALEKALEDCQPKARQILLTDPDSPVRRILGEQGWNTLRRGCATPSSKKKSGYFKENINTSLECRF